MSIFDIKTYRKDLPQLAKEYRHADIFPHIVINNFLDAAFLKKAAADFPAISGEGWIHYQHVNENKGGLNKRDLIPQKLRAIIDRLNAPDFVAWLSELTGIPSLIPDPKLEGGGLHQTKSGGFLNIHADFTVHPHQRMWRRRVNLLIYLNENWPEEYGGKLELWTRDMGRCFESILPIFNRCVIFNTDNDSYHGHPHPLTCPPERTRKSIALYYFTEEKTAPRKIATNYRARPDDGIQALWIYLDKKALVLYNRLKGVLGINDDAVSKMLKWIAKWRGRN